MIQSEARKNNIEYWISRIDEEFNELTCEVSSSNESDCTISTKSTDSPFEPIDIDGDLTTATSYSSCGMNEMKDYFPNRSNDIPELNPDSELLTPFDFNTTELFRKTAFKSPLFFKLENSDLNQQRDDFFKWLALKILSNKEVPLNSINLIAGDHYNRTYDPHTLIGIFHFITDNDEYDSNGGNVYPYFELCSKATKFREYVNWFIRTTALFIICSDNKASIPEGVRVSKEDVLHLTKYDRLKIKQDYPELTRSANVVFIHVRNLLRNAQRTKLSDGKSVLKTIEEICYLDEDSLKDICSWVPEIVEIRKKYYRAMCCFHIASEVEDLKEF